MIKIVATRCHSLNVKCTKFDFGWGSTQTPLGELTALTPPAGSKGKKRRGREWKETGNERGSGGGGTDFCSIGV